MANYDDFEDKTFDTSRTPKEITQDPRVNFASRDLIGRILLWTDYGEKPCFISSKVMSDSYGFNYKTLSRCLSSLKSLGYIDWRVKVEDEGRVRIVWIEEKLQDILSVHSKEKDNMSSIKGQNVPKKKDNMSLSSLYSKKGSKKELESTLRDKMISRGFELIDSRDETKIAEGYRILSDMGINIAQGQEGEINDPELVIEDKMNA